MIHVLLVNEIRLMCNVITAALEDEPDIKVVGCATSVDEALEKLAREEIDVVLVSTRLPERGALHLTQTITDTQPSTNVLVLGVTDHKERVLQFVEAGAIGYVLKDDSIDDMVAAIQAAQQGKALVSPKIAGALMERVSELAGMFADLETGVIETAGLTPRELEVLELLGQNMTNEEIAETLVIEVGTVKNHVHSILNKLNVNSRREAATYLALIK
ncbi:MAG: LuxR C-terminal-related transcriptional regulator, partial [Anaerolineales bacterium]